MKVAIIFIGTAKYRQFFEEYYKGVVENFLPTHEKHFFVFTDEPNDPIFDRRNVTKTQIQHQGWPFITLHRFKFIRKAESEITKFDYAFFFDADLLCVNKVEEHEIFDGSSLFGVQHPGFVDLIGSYETDTRSHANIFDGYYDVSVYRQGCLWGGKVPEFLEMVKDLDEKIDDDYSRGIVAVWHDESHMNKHFLRNPEKVKTLHAGFAMPQYGWEHLRQRFPTKFIHFVKDNENFPRFAGVK